jgi:hypothetical protein
VGRRDPQQRRLYLAQLVTAELRRISGGMVKFTRATLTGGGGNFTVVRVHHTATLERGAVS